ncbi:P-loop containing nucleoside triphosphate hydrolase protein [Bimuria novae-zelandiae CBS 107.79]|uniref:P-loop containing nucleoside triphosphate hydrolase protein n=1 Tax=Bimuria novae-zelandiae CBS 107.79 TaxID=1447943 RepID=A0A6A5V5Y0_9PLEO|nr:P-loop containing nucleoside triphosphate hydrolase protein [Bimuria novae-zelandiae CBS 107.79]
MSAACPSDGSFGPGVGSCRGGFDFTLGFEDSILGVLPQAALLLLAPIRLATLRRRRDRVARRSHLGFLKTATGFAYIFSSIILLAIWSEIDAFKTSLSVASAALESTSSLLILTLSRLEHSRAVRPSHLLQFFLLVLLLCDAVRLRTLFLMDYPASIVTPASIHTFLTGLLLLLESLDKRELFNSDGDRKLPEGRGVSTSGGGSRDGAQASCRSDLKGAVVSTKTVGARVLLEARHAHTFGHRLRLCLRLSQPMPMPLYFRVPEETIGLFGKRLFWYLNGLFKEGYGKILKPADLHSMDADLASKEREVVFQEVWAAHDKTDKRPLLRTIIKVLWPDLLLPVLPRLIQLATTLSQPYLITETIAFIENRQTADSVNKGYGLIAAFALNYTILAIASGWSAQNMARFLTKLRGCLISTLYEKTLNNSSKDMDLGNATVLMNVDVDKLIQGCKMMNEIWATFIVTGVAMYIMYTHLGAAFFAPFLTILVCAAVSTVIGAAMKVRQRVYAAATERRITALSYIVGNMKGVRMLGLSETVHRLLTSLRHEEVDASTYFRRLIVWVTLISNVMFQLTTVATYVTFAVIALAKDNGASLNLKNLYGSLSALKLFTTPLESALQLVPQIQVAYASLERIESFLKGQLIMTEPYSESNSGIDAATFAIDSQLLFFEATTHFASGTFTMVVGKVGSGKSILLRSLVGETELVSGHLKHPSSGIAFCDQQVWLRNATVRDNIIGEDGFDEKWYRKVLWGCSLLQDIREMKQGDRTSIGSKGISLSGGQKNRLSLARALYARKPILVIDDMLAGLDNRTEKLVFNRVFAHGGILHQSGTTVILASHATHYVRQSDRVIVVSNGRIDEQGTYQELIEKNVDLWKLNDGETPDSDERSERVTSIYEDETDIVVPNRPVVSAEEEEDIARQSGDRRSLLFFMKAVGTKHMTISCLTLVAGIVLQQIQYLWLKWWAEADDKSRAGTIRQLYLFIIVTAMNIFAFLVYFAHYALWFQPKLSLNMHARQLAALMRARFSFLVSTDIGSITNRFSQDIMLVDLQLPIAWLNVTFEVLVTISSIIIMTIATPPVAATIPVLGVVGYCIQRVYLRTSRQVRLMDLEAKAPPCTHFLETMAGIVTVRAFGWSEAYRKRNEKLLDQSQIPFYLLAAIQNWLTLVLELVVAGMVTALVGFAVGLRNKIDPGYLGLALISAMDLGINFRIIIIYWTELETSLSAVVRILQFSATPAEQQELNTVEPPELWPKHGSVSFSNLAASYTEDGKRVLNDINLSIHPGEKIGLCGRTGSGKSSLVATLFGLLHQREGQISIDGIPTAEVPLSVLRSKIIALPQEPLFLKGTVRYNLTPWTLEDKRPLVSEEQMKNALQQVQLWDKLSGAAEAGQSALDLNLDNVDSLLSQGERQLFCLSRAILMDGKIVVLDEATSRNSVDAHTDALMQRILRTAFADRTIIAIAHRLDTILDFDHVVVMDAGSVVEVGPPERLVQTEGSLFRALVESQKVA